MFIEKLADMHKEMAVTMNEQMLDVIETWPGTGKKYADIIVSFLKKKSWFGCFIC